MDSFILEIAPIFGWLVKTSIHASVIVLIVISVRSLLSKKLAPRWHYYLWLLVIARMLMPAAPQSALSIFNLFSASTEQTTETPPTGAVAGYKTDHTPDEAAYTGEIVTAVIEPTKTDYFPKEAKTENTIKAEMAESDSPDFTALLPVAWLVGAAGLAVYVLMGNLRLSRIVIKQRPVTDSRVLDLLEDCKSQMKLHTYLSVVETDKIASPALFGFIRPKLLLPKGLLEKLTPAQLRHVFLHELAHLKRGDIYLGWLVALLQTVHWFNPMVWYAFHRMRADRELACDQMALASIENEEPNEYGKTIVSLLEDFSAPSYNPGLAGILENRSQLKRRITMIAKHKKGSYRFSTLAAIVITMLCAVALTGAKDKTPLQEKKEMASKFVDLLLNNKFKEAVGSFDKTMKSALSPKKLKKAWNETTANAGPFEKKLGTRAEKYLFSDIIYVTCQFKEGPLDVKVMYDKSKKISGLWFVPVPEKVLKEYAEKTKGADPINSPAEKVKTLDGKLVFHGRYTHRSRNRDYSLPGEIWIKEGKDGSVNAVSDLPWMGTCDHAVSDSSGQFIAYNTHRYAAGSGTPYSIDMKLADGKVKLTRRGVREDVTDKSLAVPAGAIFSPNSRPDSYTAANILFRSLKLDAGKSKAMVVYDWDNTGEKLVDYRIIIFHVGKQSVTVPAGTFQANYYKLVQLDDANTWFKKRLGHETNFWVLDNDVIVKIHRDREPYELLLLDYKYPEKLAGEINNETEKASDLKHKTQKQPSKNSIYLPDVDGKRLMLDLASAKLVKLPDIKDSMKLLAAIDKLDKGDIVYDSRKCIFLRGLSCSESTAHPAGLGLGIYKVPADKDLPKKITLTNRRGQNYILNILSVDKGGINIEFTRTDKQTSKVISEAQARIKPGEVSFEKYFPASHSGAEALEKLWNDPKKDTRDADEILDTARNGLRLYRGRGNILRWIGNMFIWGKNPQNPKAVELMYHASGSGDRNIYGDAIYFGLSVTRDKTPEILNAMAAVAMKTEDYYNVTGRILWGCKNKKDELTACLDPYLKSDDETIRKKAESVKSYLTDSKAFMQARAKERKEAIVKSEAGNLEKYNKSLLTGDSAKRMETLKYIQSKGVMAIIDESFLDAFEACLKDSDPGVRNKAAWTIGQKYIWGGRPQNNRAINMLIPMLDDSDRKVRYTTVYFGLSTVGSPSKELLEKTLATILDDREINYYGRVIWGAKRNRKAVKEILTAWINQTEDQQKAVKAYEIYEDVTQQPLDEETSKRFEGKKSDVHEGLATMVINNKPIDKDKLIQQFTECLKKNNLLHKVGNLYIMENQQTATGMFTCENLTDRNAIRKALKEGPGFFAGGYIDGKIAPSGSGWINSLEDFRKRLKPYLINFKPKED